MQIKSFRDLRVWQAGIELVQAIYELTSHFPRSETYGLASQNAARCGFGAVQHS